jgi:hypothetical protein
VYTQLSGNLTIEHLPTVDYFEDPIMSDIDSSIMSDIDGVPMSDSDEESHQNDRYTGHEVRQSPPLLSPVAQLISRNHQRRHGMSSLFVNPSSTASNASSSSSDLEILPDPPSPRMTARNLAQWSMQTARRSPRIRELRSPAFRVPHSPQTRGRAFRSRQAHTRGTAIHHGYATHPIQTYDSNTQVDEIPVWEVEYYDMEFFEEMHDLRQMPDFTWIDAAVDWSAESVFIVVAPNVAGARNQGRGSSFAA